MARADRAMTLLFQAARVSPVLRDAALEVEKELNRLRAWEPRCQVVIGGQHGNPVICNAIEPIHGNGLGMVKHEFTPPTAPDEPGVPWHWSAGPVTKCNGFGKDHHPCGIHVIVRCVCDAAYMSTDAGLALGMAHDHAAAVRPSGETT